MQDKEIVALIAYLQRLGTDIKWREAAPEVVPETHQQANNTTGGVP